MNRKLIKHYLTTILFFFIFHLHAQLQIGGQGNLVLLSGKLSRYSETGYGAGMTIRYLFSDRTMGIGISGEYFSFASKNSFGKNNGGIYYSLIPITGYFIYQFPLGFDLLVPYAAFHLGGYNENVSAGSNHFGLNAFKDIRKLSFGVAPELGLGIAVLPNLQLNIGAKYNMIFSGAIPDSYGQAAAVNLSGQTSFLTTYGGIIYSFK